MPPNILFIAVDDLRPELACYGASHAFSPNIDSLAAQGLRFDRAYCQSPVCNPARTSVLTGLRPDTHGVFDLYTHFRDNLPDAVTLPQHFKSHGYFATAIGKIFHNDLPDPPSWSEPRQLLPGFPFDPDAVYVEGDNLAYLRQRKQEITAEGRQASFIDPLGEWYLKASATEMPDLPDDAYYDGAQTRFAIDKLASLADMDCPFFFGVGYYRPHLPFNAPKRYWDLYDRHAIPLADNAQPPVGAPHMALNNMRELRGYRDFNEVRHPLDGPVSEAEARLLKHGYLASVSYLDDQIGRLLGQLDALGIRNNTIVVLWVDHGYKLGEHGSWCKMTNYETDTRVPLIISAPGYARNATCHGLVETMDLYPTLCELCDLPVSDSIEGQSLVPQLKDPATPTKDAAFSQFYRAGIWQDPDGRDYIGHALRTETHRYVEWFDCETKARVGRELYDHRCDHGETVNVADQQNEVVSALAQRLAAASALTSALLASCELRNRRVPSAKQCDRSEDRPMPENQPADYSTVSPYLVVEDAQGLIDFMKTVFGGTERIMMKAPDGSIMHGEVCIGDSMIMVANACAQAQPTTTLLHIYVDDVDASYQAALDAGATSEREPANQFYGDRTAGVVDAFGNRWYMATNVEMVSEDELQRRHQELLTQQS